jgi:hypothetical protein
VRTSHLGIKPKKGGKPPNEINKIIILIEELFGILCQKLEIEVKFSILAAVIIILKIKL